MRLSYDMLGCDFVILAKLFNNRFLFFFSSLETRDYTVQAHFMKAHKLHIEDK